MKIHEQNNELFASLVSFVKGCTEGFGGIFNCLLWTQKYILIHCFIYWLIFLTKLVFPYFLLLDLCSALIHQKAKGSCDL